MYIYIYIHIYSIYIYIHICVCICIYNYIHIKSNLVPSSPQFLKLNPPHPHGALVADPP